MKGQRDSMFKSPEHLAGQQQQPSPFEQYCRLSLPLYALRWAERTRSHICKRNAVSNKKNHETGGIPSSFVLHKTFTVFSDSGKMKFFRFHMSYPVLGLCKFMLLVNKQVTYGWKGLHNMWTSEGGYSQFIKGCGLRLCCQQRVEKNKMKIAFTPAAIFAITEFL